LIGSFSPICTAINALIIYTRDGRKEIEFGLNSQKVECKVEGGGELLEYGCARGDR
jgi:hypothetical protein